MQASVTVTLHVTVSYKVNVTVQNKQSLLLKAVKEDHQVQTVLVRCMTGIQLNGAQFEV